MRELCCLNETSELIEYYGYPCQRHAVFTKDEWQLTLFRIPSSPNAVEAKKKRTPVILWHGLSTSSAIWTCNVGAENNLAFFLSDEGYDVWLGNNRGTNYSRHLRFSSKQDEYWDFSLDNLVEDVKATVDYVCKVTNSEKLYYVGFSQGTAQMFAALSESAELNTKVAYFAALAPAIRPRPFGCYPLRALTRVTPNIMQSLFGRQSFLSITTSVRGVVPSSLFEKLIRSSMSCLFHWNNRSFERSHERALYSHVFGVCSTKVFNHWFQVMQHGFRKYNACECLRLRHKVRSAALSFATKAVGYIPFAGRVVKPQAQSCCDTEKPMVEEYKTWNITAPVGLYYGGNDLMTDMNYINERVSGIVSTTFVEEYDHLDFVWSKDVRSKVWFPLLDDLEKH